MKKIRYFFGLVFLTSPLLALEKEVNFSSPFQSQNHENVQDKRSHSSETPFFVDYLDVQDILSLRWVNKNFYEFVETSPQVYVNVLQKVLNPEFTHQTPITEIAAAYTKHVYNFVTLKPRPAIFEHRAILLQAMRYLYRFKKRLTEIMLKEVTTELNVLKRLKKIKSPHGSFFAMQDRLDYKNSLASLVHGKLPSRELSRIRKSDILKAWQELLNKQIELRAELFGHSQFALNAISMPPNLNKKNRES